MDFSGEMQNFAIQHRRHGAKLKRSSSTLAEMQRFELNCERGSAFSPERLFCCKSPSLFLEISTS